MGRLNTKVSNGPWLGDAGKRHGLQAHDVLFLNRDLLDSAGEGWTEAAIRSRTDELAKAILSIWPVPAGHQSGFAHEKAKPRHKVDLADLISAGWLQPGTSLAPRRKKFADLSLTLLSDGRVDLDGSLYTTPSEAAVAITGKPTNGWWFFLVDEASRRSLRDVRREYLDSLAVEDDDIDDDGDDDEG
jgi:hypothetical protein